MMENIFYTLLMLAMAVCAYRAMISNNLLSSALYLACVSALVSVTLYLLGAYEVAGMNIGSMFKDLVVSFFSAPVTEKYPFEKIETAERFRGKLWFDPAKCTGCNLCSIDCPAQALDIVIIDRAAKCFVAQYNMDRCIYCSQCVQSCRFKCLGMSNEDWELAALSKASFVVNYGKEEDIASLLERSAAAKSDPTPQ